MFMSKNQITKEEVKLLILKQIHKVSNENQYSSDPKSFASRHLNELLDRIEEFRY